MAWWLFQNVVATAILALIVVAVCRAIRLSPVVRHALWVLVLIKFITPPVMTWPWRVPDPLGIQALDAQLETREDSVASNGALAPNSGDQSLLADLTPSTERALRAEPGSTEPRVSRPGGLADARNVWSWLLMVWAAGAAVILLVEAVRLIRVARLVRSAREADPRIVERVLILAARLDMRPVDVVAVPNATAPAMWCFGRPRLLWPAELPPEFTDTSIDGLIVHELAHIKRRDHIVGWIELGVGVIWWWNPLFWFVRSALREQAELACDGWVIAALPNGRRAYAESLLALSSVAIVDVPASPMSAVLGVRARSRQTLERRLVMIMKGRASRRLSVFGLVGLGMMAAATLPVWATAPQQATTVVQQVPPPAPVTVTSYPQTPPPPMAPSAMPLPVTATSYPQTPPASPQGQLPRPAVATTVAPSPSAPAVVPVMGGQQPRPATVTAAPVAPVPGQNIAQTTVARPAMQGQRPGTATTAPAPAQGGRGAGQGIGQGQGGQIGAAMPIENYRYSYTLSAAQLPADAQTQVKSYETERDALQQEVERKLEGKRAELKKTLQALQDSYTKAGKLDEAVAIRDYIRSLDQGGLDGWVRGVKR